MLSKNITLDHEIGDYAVKSTAFVVKSAPRG